MRKINEIIVHCTATPEGREFKVADIDAMHRQRGFSSIGYHYLIGLDGKVSKGRPVEQAGAHVAGRNANTIGVSYVGGIDRSGRAKDTRTPAQKAALAQLLAELVARFPSIQLIEGHRAYANKACPCFDARKEYAGLVAQAPVSPGVERYAVKGAQRLLASPMGDPAKALPKNAVIETTGHRAGDWVEVTHGETLGWVHDTEINQREVPEARSQSRTIWGQVVAGSGVIGTAMTSAAQALDMVKDAAPWIIGATVALTIGGIVISTLAKIQDTGAGVQE
jgi:hypothetical protein